MACEICLCPFLSLYYLITGIFFTSIGIIKGTIMLVPCACILLPSVLATTIVYFPKVLFQAYLSVATTRVCTLWSVGSGIGLALPHLLSPHHLRHPFLLAGRSAWPWT